MEGFRFTKNKMFKRKNQTEENKWLLETLFCKLSVIIIRLKFRNGLNQNAISSLVTCINIESDYLRFALIDNAQCLFISN